MDSESHGKVSCNDGSNEVSDFSQNKKFYIFMNALCAQLTIASCIKSTHDGPAQDIRLRFVLPFGPIPRGSAMHTSYTHLPIHRELRNP